MNWHADSSVFESECAQFPGFLTVFRNALNSSPSAASNKQEQLDYENFRHVCHKWHYKLTKSFIVCLESKEYLQMRNSLIILTKIAPHYPKLTGFSSALEKRVESIKQVEKDKRQDIYTLASAYLGQLKMRKSQMVEESKFHLKEPSTMDASASTKSNPSAKSASQNLNGNIKKATSSQGASGESKFKQPATSSKSSGVSQSVSLASTLSSSTSGQVNGTKSTSQSNLNGLAATTTSSTLHQASQAKSLDLNQNNVSSKTNGSSK